ncbi:antA/AntB antirepressor family protein [Candidatus Williamhamiltonella defendens]|nr:antA/AntB antirepressor family protein [Candidatus Hamiltonella defensa]
MTDKDLTMSQTHPLIAIKARLINGETVQTVNARDLYHFLEVRLSFSTWMKQYIKKYEWVDNTDYLVFTHSGPHAGRPFKDYVLTLEKAKEMAMLTRTEKGHELREYLMNVDKEPFESLNDPAELRRLLLTYTDKVRALENRLNEILS